MDACEVEARRLGEPPFGGWATHEFRALATSTAGPYLAGRRRYKGPHAVDLGIAQHRDALEALATQLTQDGWRATGDHGQAAYALRFTREGSRRPTSLVGSESSGGLGDWLTGLTKHTKRLGIFLLVGLVAAALVDLVRGRAQLLGEWPTIVSIAYALVWIMAATDDFKMGTHKRIPRRVEGEGTRHPVGWYRFFLTHVVQPNAALFGWLIPGSMYVVALAYLTGILVPLAALGALFLLGNMYLFLNLRQARDDFVALFAGQVIILLTNPGGLPRIAAALGIGG